MSDVKIGLDRYPEFKDAVNKIVKLTAKSINEEAKNIVSEMPYKRQFLLEEVIQRLHELV